MKIHTTNYVNTFIEVAEDCPAVSGEIPPLKGKDKAIAAMEYELLSGHPYQYSSDDVLFMVFAQRRDLTKKEMPAARKAFFSKGQACLRASPLTKRYGWGVHYNGQGKIAIYGMETEQYRQFIRDEKIRRLKAMRSAR